MTNEPLYMQIRKYVLSLIEQNQGGGDLKLPSEHQLCLRFQASRVAVRHALSELAETGLITRARGRGTFINVSGPRPPERPAEQPFAGILMPTANSLEAVRLADGAMGVLSRKDIIMAIYPTCESIDLEARQIQFLRSRGAMGMLIASCCFNQYSDALLHVTLSGFPTVQLDWALPGLALSMVSLDYHQAFYEAAKRLCEKGHRTIGYLSHPRRSSSSSSDGVAGYEACMRDMGGPSFSGYLLDRHYRDPDYREALIQFLTDVKPTALLLDNYYYELHVKDVFRELGIRPMEDIELTVRGTHYHDLMSYGDMTPNLIDLRSEEVGRLAAQELLQLAGGKKPGEHILVPGRVLMGDEAKKAIEECRRTLILPRCEAGV